MFARNPPVKWAFLTFLLTMFLLSMFVVTGCVLGEKVGYNNNDSEDLGRKLEQVVRNPPQSYSEWIYALTGIGACLFGLWVRSRFFSGPKEGVAVASQEKENKVVTTTKAFLNGMMK